jgi:hypothetical protein
MIKIPSFYPLSNFLRVTHEFHEDKATVTMKSLTYEHAFEFIYTDVVEISYEKHASGIQQFLGIGLSAVAVLILAFFSTGFFTDPVLLLGTQTFFIFSILLFSTGLIKNRKYCFCGEKEEITSIKMSFWNDKAIKSAVEMVKKKSKHVKEIDPENPFPKEKPRFELVEYDISDYWSKNTDKFFEEELIGHYKNAVTESVYRVKYNQLNGKIYHGKAGNDNWSNVFWITLFVDSVFTGFYLIFDTLPKGTYQYFSVISIVVLVSSFLLKYVKKEMLGLYDKNNRIVFWTWITKSNREKVNKIIEFVQSKITAENKI